MYTKMGQLRKLMLLLKFANGQTSKAIFHLLGLKNMSLYALSMLLILLSSFLSFLFALLETFIIFPTLHIIRVSTNIFLLNSSKKLRNSIRVFRNIKFA
jgi:hypothetical protein